MFGDPVLNEVKGRLVVLLRWRDADGRRRKRPQRATISRHSHPMSADCWTRSSSSGSTCGAFLWRCGSDPPRHRVSKPCCQRCLSGRRAGWRRWWSGH